MLQHITIALNGNVIKNQLQVTVQTKSQESKSNSSQFEVDQTIAENAKTHKKHTYHQVTSYKYERTGYSKMLLTAIHFCDICFLTQHNLITKT